MTDNEQVQTRIQTLPKQSNIKEVCSYTESGRTCPACHQGRLDYNGLLNLVCPHCGREWSGSFT